ncbi:MAG: hypothetical protein L0215_17890 [Gemmataceae bacterium]|nr:hypothetical protein [Gemmataceae bacterium]
MTSRLLFSVFAVSFVAHAAHAQTVLLSEGPLPKSCFRIELSMDLLGEVRVQQEGKTVSMKQTAAAKHVFLERIIDAKQGVAEKTARVYQKAEARIAVDKEIMQRSLRPERSWMIAMRTKDVAIAYAPKGLLSQEEMELTEHLDTLYVPGLLSGKDAKPGDTWKVTGNVVNALCDLDGLVHHDLTGKLEAVAGDQATGNVFGQVEGIDLGATVHILVQARFTFDLKEKRITFLEWKQSDQRQQGPVNPALSADVTYTLRRTPIEEPKELSDDALAAALAVAPDKMTLLHFRDAKGGFEFQHSRDWHLVGQQDNQIAFRLMDRRDFVAQMTVMRYKNAEKMMELDAFADLMSKAPGWEQEALLEKTDQVPGDHGHRVYRVGASGKLDGVAAVQYFHLVHAQGGAQLLVTCTLRPEQVQHLRGRDLAVLRSIALK